MARRDARAQARGARRNVDGRRRERNGRRYVGVDDEEHARAIVRDGPNVAMDHGALQRDVLPLVMREDQTNATKNVEAFYERLEGV